MAKYRDTLTFVPGTNPRKIVLQCNKSEKKSLVKHHLPDGSSKWMPDTVASTHADGTPKHLHITIGVEGIYEIVGQPLLSGVYCFYTASNGHMSYRRIDWPRAQKLFAALGAAGSYRQALIAIGEAVY